MDVFVVIVIGVAAYCIIDRLCALDPQFPIERRALKHLTKFVGSGGGISLTFDGLLLDERIFYDPETDTLTIKGTPPNLRDQLCRR
ncbi:hypothetical protein DZ860_17070 [Vibrio sinensis]|uniref:Uncharacterized protein n=1 Tax=Vibrio sinensis TaxID=2302434 RepID=A0A3A6QZM7_9VIBR|nr:hypothetical protein DZ860_17070 [Vibrio sinensis]